MSYSNSAGQESRGDRAVAGLLVAGIMFVMGYTLVRVALTPAAPQDAAVNTPVVPHEATLWSAGFAE